MNVAIIKPSKSAKSLGNLIQREPSYSTQASFTSCLAVSLEASACAMVSSVRCIRFDTLDGKKFSNINIVQSFTFNARHATLVFKFVGIFLSKKMSIAEPPRCMRDGCTNDDVPLEKMHVCKGCGIATYCSPKHGTEHWKFHHDECNIQEVMGADGHVPWLVEEGYPDPADETQNVWEPVPVYYAIDQGGDAEAIGSSFITSAQLAEAYNRQAMPDFDALIGEQQAEDIGAKAVTTSVRSGATRLKGVPCGTTPDDVSASIRIQVRSLDADLTFKNIDVTYHFPAKQLSKHICISARSGVSFKLPASFLDSKTHMRNMEGVLTAFPEHATMTVTITYGNKSWIVDGGYNIPNTLNKPSDASFRARARATVLQLGRFGRRTLTGTSEYRIKAKTANNVTVVMFLQRGVASHRGGTPLYNLRQIEVHVPREAINSPEIPDYKVLKEVGFEGSDDTESKIDNELRTDMLALYDCIQDERDEMRQTFDEAQTNMDVSVDERTKIHAQLSNLSRLCSLIGTHVQTLEREEKGEIEPENISYETQQAINDALQFIEENVFTRTSRRGARGFRDWRAIRKHRREIKKMNQEDLLRMFVDNVNTWEDSLSTNTEATRVREMARAEQEAILSDSRFRDLKSRKEFRDANVKFMNLIHQGASVGKRKKETRKLYAAGGGEAPTVPPRET